MPPKMHSSQSIRLLEILASGLGQSKKAQLPDKDVVIRPYDFMEILCIPVMNPQQEHKLLPDQAVARTQKHSLGQYHIQTMV